MSGQTVGTGRISKTEPKDRKAPSTSKATPVIPFQGTDGPGRDLAVVDVGLVALVGVVISLFCLFKVGPVWMNADTPILAVMSLQKVTLFFWGENRFLNLIPLLASPVRQPDWNLLVQVCLFGGGFVGLLAVIGRVGAIVIFSSRARIDFYLCFSVLLLGFLILASRFAIHVFIVEGQPYGASGLLTGLGLTGLLSRHGFRGFILLPSVFALILAGGFNPSLLVVTAAICVAVAVFDPSRRRRAMIVMPLTCTCFLGWLIYSRIVPGPTLYMSWTNAPIWWNALAALSGLLRAFEGTAYSVGVGVALLACLITLRLDGTLGRIGVLSMLLFGFAVGWLVLFSNNAWVSGNGYHFRYFFPVIITIVVLVTLPVLGLVMRGTRTIRLGAAVLAMVGCLLITMAPPKRFDDFALFARFAERAQTARSSGISLIAGDFWSVWPVVFLLLRNGDAFGIDGLRDVGNRDGVRRHLDRLVQDGATPSSLCLDASIERCLQQAYNLTGRQWIASGNSCGTQCSVISMGEPAK
jgi:hypothetical protein